MNNVTLETASALNAKRLPEFAMVDRKAEPDRQRMIAIAGGKGGVGKTVLSAIMALAIAEKGYKTVVVDADLGGANLHQVLGIPAPPITIKNVLDDRRRDINELVIGTVLPNLFLLAGATGVVGLANLGYGLKQKIIRQLRNIDADFIVLDLGAGSGFDQLDFYLQADIGIVVITPEPLAVQDGYNFVKLCLYRRLARLFGNDIEIGGLLKVSLFCKHSSPSPTIQELSEQVMALESPAKQQWELAIGGFHPKVVMNMIETEQDLNECMALQITARDLLNIEIDQVEYIKYDEDLRRAAKKMQPDLLLPKGGGAAGQIRGMVEHFLFNGVTSQPQNGETLSRKKQTPTNGRPYDGEVICSILCSLWGDCRMQMGGYPCRIRVVGFFNRK